MNTAYGCLIFDRQCDILRMFSMFGDQDGTILDDFFTTQTGKHLAILVGFQKNPEGRWCAHRAQTLKKTTVMQQRNIQKNTYKANWRTVVPS